jgi:subtilisin family serine protease
MSPLKTLGPIALLLLAACGGGGGASHSDDDGDGAPPPAAASPTQVLVDPKDVEDLGEIEEETGARVIGPVEGTTFWLVEIPAGMDVEEFLDEISGDLRVEDSDEDEGAQFPEGGLSTVPLFGDEVFASIPVQPALDAIGLPAARARATGAGLVVAVVDTGIDPTHPALAGRVLPGGWDFVGRDADPTDAPDGIDQDGDGRVDEGVGHGTFVASLVLAVAPDASILPIRALDSDALGTASTVASAIYYAVSHGAHVVNVSAGLPRDMEAVKQAVERAREAGVPVVAAAGNRQANVDYPAMLSDTFGVTGLAPTGAKAPFASYGSAVDLCAPAVDLLGAHPLSPSGTARWSGTSFSSALVAGGCALLLELHPTWDASALLSHLRATGTDVSALDPAFAGRLGVLLDLDAATAP